MARSGRWDIQGLRAVAVLAVIVDHIWAWPGGGFVGVDVFFVISGFLITGLLLREYERTGHISFVGFYRRRIKRILPASTLVVVATVVAGIGIFRPSQFADLRIDAIWAVFFAANWRFGLQETDYFNLDRAISPLQHYWSLAVEEQFYFVWPWVMLAIFALFAHRAHSLQAARISVGSLIAIIVMSSFGYALYSTNTDAHSAYFSSFTRVWELGIGAGLAVAVPLLMRIPDRIRPVLAWVGLAGIVAGMVLVEGDQGFPAPAAALPVLATAVVIAGGTYRDPKRQLRGFWILTNRGAHYIGDISFSLYLWHFPVIILFSTWYGDRDLTFYALTVLLIAALSVFSYEVVGTPLRKLDWRTSARAWREGHNWRKAQYASLGLLTSVTVTFSVLSLTTVQTITPSLTALEIEQLQNEQQDDETPAVVMPPLAQAQQDAVLAALQSSTFPNLKPGIDTLTTEHWIESLTQGVGCANVSADNVEQCIFGPSDAKKTAVLIGDSYGMSWMPAVRGALEPQYRTTQLTRGECPAWGVPMVDRDGEPFAECADHLEWAIKTSQSERPDLVLISQSNLGIGRVVEAGDPLLAITQGFTAILSQLKALGSRVVVLSPPPGSTPLQDCTTRTSTPDDCVTPINDGWEDVNQAETAAAQAAGVEHFDTRSWFCAFDRCPGWIGTTPIRADGGHMTLDFAATLGPVLREALEQPPAA